MNGNWRVSNFKPATGRPAYIKQDDATKILYYDPDCDGVANLATPRFIFDNQEQPVDLDRVNDLDGDLQCSYYARLDATWSNAFVIPQGDITLRSACGGTWVDDTISVSYVAPTSNTFHPLH